MLSHRTGVCRQFRGFANLLRCFLLSRLAKILRENHSGFDDTPVENSTMAFSSSAAANQDTTFKRYNNLTHSTGVYCAIGVSLLAIWPL